MAATVEESTPPDMATAMVLEGIATGHKQQAEIGNLVIS
jgi:hypothetical protein